MELKFDDWLDRLIVLSEDKLNSMKHDDSNYQFAWGQLVGLRIVKQRLEDSSRYKLPVEEENQ